MDQPSKDELSMLTRVNLIFRFSYTIPFLLASVCGVVYAVPYDVPWHIMVLIPVAVLLLALFVNFSNDYFDHKSGVDKKVNDRKSRTRDNLMTSDAVKRVYWEGNQFDTGLVTERQGKAIMAALLVLIVIVALPVIAYGGWSVVVLGLIGAALAFFYTAPPVNLGARGMSANDVHLEMHEVNMSIRLGTEGTVRAIKAVVVIAYVLAALMCYYNLLNVLLFATLLITVKMVRVIDARREHWDVAIIPFSFLFSLLTEVLFLVVTLCTMAVGPVVFW